MFFVFVFFHVTWASSQYGSGVSRASYEREERRGAGEGGRGGGEVECGCHELECPNLFWEANSIPSATF